MKAEYLDIKNKIKEEPKWYDENGVPRYDTFSPELSPNIYADEVVLLEIACQSCRKRFFVEMNWDRMRVIFGNDIGSFSELLERKINPIECILIPYSDPPRHNCVGDTMTSDSMRIVQFWKRGDIDRFVRIHKYEITLDEV